MKNLDYRRFQELRKQWQVENSLFRKLRPELVKTINEHLDDYPTSTQSLIEELESHVYLRDIKYGDILTMQLWFGGDNPYIYFEERETFEDFLNRNDYDG